jgi:hypothetical protein
MKNIMYVVENGVTGEWKDWFKTEELANAYRTEIETDNEYLKGHHTVRSTKMNVINE